jgi:hypothetical protein
MVDWWLDGRQRRSWQAEGLPVTDIAEGPPHRSFELTDADGHVVVVRDSHVIGPV